MTFSQQAKQDLLWWVKSIETSKKPISQGNPDITIHPDASLAGWGAHYDNQTTGGRWSTVETECHINGGSHSKPCNTREIWLWCIERNIWVTASHVPSVQNDVAGITRI